MNLGDCLSYRNAPVLVDAPVHVGGFDVPRVKVDQGQINLTKFSLWSLGAKSFCQFRDDDRTLTERSEKSTRP